MKLLIFMQRFYLTVSVSYTLLLMLQKICNSNP